jgi:AraC family transcriptional regulator
LPTSITTAIDPVSGASRPLSAAATPVLSHTGSNILLEHVQLPPGEVPPSRMLHHTLGVNLGPTRSVHYSVEGRWSKVDIPPGAASFFPAGALVSARWLEPSEVAMISFDPRWLTSTLGLSRDPLADRESLVIADTQVELLTNRVLQEVITDQPGRDIALPALGSLLAVQLIRYFGSTPPAPGREHLTPRQIRVVTDLIRASYNTPHTVESLAAAVQLSPFHFARAFRNTIGLTPAEFVRRERIARAAELLQQTNLPVQEIAQRTGFASHAHFTQVFRKSMGASPADFRSARRLKGSA